MYFNQHEIGERIRSLRRSRQMRIGELADAIHCSREHLSRTERGERNISVDLLIDIAGYFSTSLDWLILGISIPNDEVRKRLLTVIEELTSITKDLV